MTIEAPNKNHASTPSEKRHAVVVVHNSAPSANAMNWVDACSRGLGPGVEVREVRCDDFAAVRAAAKEAAEGGAWLVISVGGDGTANQIVNGIGAHPTLLCPLPGGTHNELAYQMGLSKDPAENVKALSQFEPIEIDAMRINGHRCAFLCSIGWGGDALHTLNMLRAKGPLWRALSRPFGTFIFTAAMLWKGFADSASVGGPMKITYKDLKDQSQKTLNLDIFNMVVVGPPTVTGGKLKWIPFSDMADGKFEALIFLRTATAKLPAINSAMTKGTLLDMPEITHIQTTQMEITMSKNINFMVDGDRIPSSDTYKVDLDPAPIRIWAPKGKRPGSARLSTKS